MKNTTVSKFRHRPQSKKLINILKRDGKTTVLQRLLLNVGILSASLTLGVSAAIAAESTLTLNDLRQLEEIAPQPTTSIAVEIPEPAPAETLAQVTSVSELSDVQPGDWAFTALQRLVEEYGCLEGYPDRTFRGNRAITRYEFAAGLNACLDVLSFGFDDAERIDEARRLQEEFAEELIAVRSQVDTLESNVAELEANQFSTTTKFSAQFFSSLSFATADGDVQAEGINVFAPSRDPDTNEP
ncbi:MAG: iron uptake porin, partial [Cyanobacteria bacterium P01_D01_bin.36]